MTRGPYTTQDLLLDATGRAGGRVAVIDGDLRLTYAELLDAARAHAGALAGRGVGRGDRVALLLPRSADALAALYGVFLIGAVAVPLSDRLKAPQVAHALTDAGASAVVTDARHEPLLGSSSAAHVLVGDRGRLEGVAQPPAPTIGRDLAVLLYTSGSTGMPKGVMVTHENLVSGASIVADYLDLTPDDRLALALPLSFDYGLNQVTSAALASACVVVERSTHPAALCRTLEREAVTGLAGVPLLWQQLLARHSPFAGLPLPALRYATNTGGVLSPAIVSRLRVAKPDLRLFLMYGLTEAFRSTYLDPSEVDARPDSIGRPIPNTEVLVLDDDGRECAPNEVGELIHRGPTVAAGYWGDPEATARTFRSRPVGRAGSENVVYSGDLVRRDQAGFLYFVGRRDALFKSHGIRVNPDEIELELRRCVDVADVIAFLADGEPSDATPPIVAAVVAAGEGDTRAEVERFCRTDLPPHMRPVRLLVVDDIPRTPHGKPDRVRASELWGGPG